MLVMPLRQFQAQGRIVKSTKAWREEAMEKKWLIEYKEGSGKIAIYVSHMWWDRMFVEEGTDDIFRVGAPDYQADYPDEERKNKFAYYGGTSTYQRSRNLKWRIICEGVQRLIKRKALHEEDVTIWIDWQSISQDDTEQKEKQVRSLIRYATMSQFMLVPTEEEGGAGQDLDWRPQNIPGYGTRAWCRLEFFVFSLLAEMQGRVMQRDAKGKHVKGTGVQLYAIKRDGELKHYPYVQFVEKWMPSGGRLTVPADASLIKSVEDRMIDAYGHALVEIKCKAGPTETVYGMMVDFTKCMLRKQHVQSLMAAVDAYQVEMLNLHGNQLGPEGGMKLAEMLKANTTLTWLEVCYNGMDDDARKAIRVAWGSPRPGGGPPRSQENLLLSESTNRGV